MAIRPELRDELMRLSAEERLELADELYESVPIPAAASTWHKEWSAELERRSQEVQDSTVDLVDGDEAHARLRDELARLRR